MIYLDLERYQEFSCLEILLGLVYIIIPLHPLFQVIIAKIIALSSHHFILIYVLRENNSDLPILVENIPNLIIEPFNFRSRNLITWSLRVFISRSLFYCVDLQSTIFSIGVSDFSSFDPKLLAPIFVLKLWKTLVFSFKVDLDKELMDCVKKEARNNRELRIIMGSPVMVFPREYHVTQNFEYYDKNGNRCVRLHFYVSGPYRCGYLFLEEVFHDDWVFIGNMVVEIPSAGRVVWLVKSGEPRVFVHKPRKNEDFDTAAFMAIHEGKEKIQKPSEPEPSNLIETTFI